MLTPPIDQNDHVLGGGRALVALAEFGDYECPFCGRAHMMMKAALQRMAEHVVFAFRHFPLAQAHPHAWPAALAAEAAGAQGRFWPMHDTLFENQDALENDDLLAYADDLGLDMGRFAADMKDGTHRAKVRSDFHSGVRSGVNGTPTFFIDGQRFDGSWTDGSLTLMLASLIQGRAEGQGRGAPLE
jgi:protein-disulfide isomerase